MPQVSCLWRLQMGVGLRITRSIYVRNSNVGHNARRKDQWHPLVNCTVGCQPFVDAALDFGTPLRFQSEQTVTCVERATCPAGLMTSALAVMNYCRTCIRGSKTQPGWLWRHLGFDGNKCSSFQRLHGQICVHNRRLPDVSSIFPTWLSLLKSARISPYDFAILALDGSRTRGIRVI